MTLDEESIEHKYRDRYKLSIGTLGSASFWTFVNQFFTVTVTYTKNIRVYNKAFHGFGQAKFPYVGLVLGSSQFSQVP